MPPTEHFPWSPPHPVPRRLQTPRLTIRSYEPSDAPALYDAVRSSMDHLRTYMPWCHVYTGVDVARSSIESFAKSFIDPLDPQVNDAHGVVLGIFDRATGRFLGGTGYPRIRAAAHCSEIGYWLRADATRQGYITEATRHMLSWGFAPQSDGGWGFHRLMIQVHEPNDASIAVPRRLGMRHEMFEHRARNVDGIGWTGMHSWALVHDEWNRETHSRR
jgi:RimJ/RimL family protein N-acetyltransferase